MVFLKILYILQFKATVSDWHKLGDTNMACRILERLPVDAEVTLVGSFGGMKPDAKQAFLDTYPAVKTFIDVTQFSSYRNYMKKTFDYLSSEGLLEGYDIIHVHNSSIPIIHYINKYMKGKKVVFTLHSPTENMTFQYYQKDEYLEFVRDLNNTLVCVSESHRSRVMRSLGLQESECPDTVVSIVNGIATEERSVNSYEPYACGTIGRLNSSKSMLESLNCIVEITRQRGGQGFLVGSQSIYEESTAAKGEKDYYEEILRVLQENPQITWHKSMHPWEIQELLANTRCYISLSRIETFGLTVCEAILQGTPCIGFDEGGIGEIIEEGKTGYKFKPSRQRWSSRYREVVDMYDRCLQLDRNSIREIGINRFNIDRVASEYMNLYNNIVEGDDD